MQASAIGALAPVMLLCAAFGSWSIISLFFLLAFFVVQYKSQRRARHVTPRPLLWMSVVLLATGVIVTEGFIELAWAMVGSNWEISESPWLDLLGLSRLNPWEGNLGVFFSLLPQFGVAITAACALYHEQQLNGMAETSSWGEEGSHWRGTLRNFLLPSIQIVVGVARPSWIALPYFVCSCVGLLHWSMTSNFVGLSWGWRPLLSCTGVHILLLYLYQLPISFPYSLTEVANYFGLFKVSAADFGWPEGLQAAALVALYILLCIAISDLQDEQYMRLTTEGGSVVEDSLPRFHTDTRSSSTNHRSEEGLTESLLPSQLPTSQRDTIQARRWVGDQRRAAAFQHATINFITYGFPVCLIALVCWSFIYASLCAFGLLLYVGYIFYGFPSVIKLRQLNPVLLGFILSWALSSYVFNAAFSVISEQSQMGMEFWHSIGLWHYSAPGLFIFAQFALGVLVATDIFVSNVIIQSMSEAESPSEDQGGAEEDSEDWKVLILAVIAWCLRRSSYVISLVLIFMVGMKDGLLHAVYIGFFLFYLVSSAVAKRTRQYLILFCELHFSALYLLQLDWISSIIERHQVVLKPILSQLGLWSKAKFQDFLSIAVLLCFLAVQSHGFKVLSSLSATIQQSPQPPLGWGILRVGSRPSVLMSVYASQNFGYLQQESSNNVNWVTKHLAAIAETVRATYRSFGTYIVYGTVLCVIYLVEPNYVSLGYLCLLLLWVIGRQIIGHTTAYLWYPLMIFAGIVFVSRYILSAFPDLRKFLDKWLSMDDDFGFNPQDSLFGHLWDSLAILAAMQLFRFERAQVAILTDESEECEEYISQAHGLISFLKRLAILHSGKVLALTVFYASITPVSATGFLYLVMLIITCNMSKTSRLPGQLYAVYTGILVISEYLFQLLGQRFEMFPGQTHGKFAGWLGFHVYGKGFEGVEFGLRSKVLILVGCVLQYCTFYWLEQLPPSLRSDEQFGEPCSLFVPHPPHRRGNHSSFTPSSDVDLRSEGPQGNIVQDGPNALQSSDSTVVPTAQIPDTQVLDTSVSSRIAFRGFYAGSSSKPTLDTSSGKGEQVFADKSRLSSPWGSAKESRRWTKRAGLLQKQERYEAQLRTLNIYVKSMIEHFFQYYGLQISMLALLVAGFALLNVISLCYVSVLGLCIVLKRRILRTIWPFFVMVFACVLITEYVVLGKGPPSWSVSPGLKETVVRCNDCAFSSTAHSDYCWQCWLGLVVDDRQVLVAHFMVFLIASLQLRVNMTTSEGARSFHANISPDDRLAWKEISYETTGQWTWLDHVRFFFYRHLLHVVLLLVFATGTLQYDVLHLGYLTFSLIFFRMRSTIMTKRNSVFMFLRLYNYILIVASLLYQAPYAGFLATEKCAVNADIYNIVGLYKMKFGFRITARSALVDITIFCVAGLQAHIFRSREFEQVLRFLEAEQVEARAHAQEHKAAYKKEHLQRIRETEERKLQRRLQVEKMKTDMLHLQLRLDVLNSTGKFTEVTSPMIELDRRPSYTPFTSSDTVAYSAEDPLTSRGLKRFPSDTVISSSTVSKPNTQAVPTVGRSEPVEDFQVRRRRRISWQGPEAQEVTSAEILAAGGGRPGPSAPLRKASSDVVAPSGQESPFGQGLGSPEHNKKFDDQWQKQRLLSGVQLLGDGVAQVQVLGNKALSGIMGFLNIDPEDDTENSSTDEEGKPGRADNNPTFFENTNKSSTFYDDNQKADSEVEKQRMSETWRRLNMLCQYFWIQISSNTDIVCYFFFVIAYTWNFSFLTLVFPATLFLYALLANPGPSQHYWLAMLVYTELNILLQYMYQIHVQNCEVKDVSVWLIKLGIPGSPMDHSFVISVLPLFLVYLATLVQSSIKARDGEWVFVNDSHSFASARRLVDMEGQTRDHRMSLKDRLLKGVRWVRDLFSSFRRALSRYWEALRNGSEAPPHFVQVSLLVGKWPEDGIQPERIESGINRLLTAVRRSSSVDCSDDNDAFKDVCSRVRVESIENSPGKPNMALAVLEVIYAAPPRGYTPGAFHHTLTPAADVAGELLRAKDEGLVEETAFPYSIVSVIPGGKREVDLYALIFGTDLIAFLYVALFYQSAMKHSEQLLEVYQVEDQFPKEFVFVLMTLFFLIMVDRVLYLCSFATGKVIYYFFSFTLYTAYVSDFVWSILGAPGNEKHFFQLLPLRGFYLMKALSSALQAVQLKFGLPHKSTLYGQFLTRKVNSTSWLGFRLYRALPFLYELRCVLDWSCTTTALTMYDWLKLEDIYASLYLVQCDIKMVREKHRLGEKQGVWIKFCSGVLLFASLIGVIWAPMLIYSSGNPTNIVNQINDVRATIEVKTAGGKFPIFQTGLCQVPFLGDVLKPDSTPAPYTDPYSFLTSSSYDIRDVQLICCEEDADSLWMIPPPTLKSLMDSIDDDIMFQTRWEFNRDRPKGKEVATIPSDVVGMNSSFIAQQLREVLNGTLKSFTIPNMYPRYFRIPGSGDVRTLEGTVDPYVESTWTAGYVTGNLTFNRGVNSWWSFTRDDAHKEDGCGNAKGPIAFTVSEEVPRGIIGETLSKFSIWSIYITFVLAVGRFIRLQCSDIRMRIPFENFPACDRLVAICEDIYAARAERELELEEGLFWTLIKIYRSPHILMEYTKVE